MTNRTKTPPRCSCGCGNDAAFMVTGFEYDPKAPGGRGKAFTDFVCHGAAGYLSESSAELGFPYTQTRVL